MFDLDEAPEDDQDDLEMGDEFDLGDEDEEMDESEEDSAFASSNEGENDEDEDMEDDDELPPHMRPNPIPTGSDDEDGLMTNLEDDLENDGYSLPVVEGGGEQEEHEHGTSLREVEQRMRWLVRVCAGKDEKVKGIPGR